MTDKILELLLGECLSVPLNLDVLVVVERFLNCNAETGSFEILCAVIEHLYGLEWMFDLK